MKRFEEQPSLHYIYLLNNSRFLKLKNIAEFCNVDYSQLLQAINSNRLTNANKIDDSKLSKFTDLMKKENKALSTSSKEDKFYQFLLRNKTYFKMTAISKFCGMNKVWLSSSFSTKKMLDNPCKLRQFFKWKMTIDNQFFGIGLRDRVKILKCSQKLIKVDISHLVINKEKYNLTSISEFVNARLTDISYLLNKKHDLSKPIFSRNRTANKLLKFLKLSEDDKKAFKLSYRLKEYSTPKSLVYLHENKDILNVQACADTFNIPYYTLRRYVMEGKSVHDTHLQSINSLAAKLKKGTIDGRLLFLTKIKND